MASERPHTPPSSPDGDGVRVVRNARPARRSALLAIVPIIVVIILIAGVVAWRTASRRSATLPGVAPISAVDAPADPAAATTPPRSVFRPDTALVSQTPDAPNDDPTDLANYVQPGDPEPTGAEVIGALHDLDIHTGIGAFNPPGTSPPLEGLAVPEEYALPKGYVRHYQSTDAGEPIEPILMYSPDVTLRDASGKPIAMPADRVVPIDRAPPGLPVRWVHIPRP